MHVDLGKIFVGTVVLIVEPYQTQFIQILRGQVGILKTRRVYFLCLNIDEIETAYYLSCLLLELDDIAGNKLGINNYNS